MLRIYVSKPFTNIACSNIVVGTLRIVALAGVFSIGDIAYDAIPAII